VRRGATTAAALSLLTVLSGCGSGSPTASSSASSTSTSSAPDAYSYSDPASVARYSADTNLDGVAGLPPRTFDGLTAIYQPMVEPYGMRLTRGAVIRLPTGPHLQLYVEPTGTAISSQDYLDRVVALTKLTAPDIFASYSGVATFDICQEPPPGVDDRVDPVPITVVFLTRGQVERVSWDTVTLKALRQVVNDLPGGRLEVSDTVQQLNEWKSAEPR
jgi:hypothetical protein